MSIKQRLESLMERKRKAEEQLQRIEGEHATIEKRAKKLAEKIRSQYGMEPKDLMAHVEKEEAEIEAGLAEIEGKVDGNAATTGTIDL